MNLTPHTTRRSRGAALVVLAAAVASASLTAQAPAAGRTVWDGVYTEAQAERATTIFGASCANCHTLTATGTRPLSGDKFWQSYTQKTVGDLLTYMRTSMPNGNPGSLPAASYNDLVALILKSNGLPAGTAEFTPETHGVVQIIPKDGPGELPANTLARIVGCLSPKKGADWIVTNATAPVRIDKPGPGADDSSQPLGDRTTALKFVLSRLDGMVGQRVSVSGILMGPGGSDGINVTLVNTVAPTCP